MKVQANSMVRRSKLGLAAAAALLTLGVTHAMAASATWNAIATNGVWEADPGENNWSTGDGTYPGSLLGISTDVATFSNNSNVSSIAINSTVGNVSPLYIGAIGFSGNTLTTNYTIGSTTGNALVVASNASQTTTTNQIFISGSLRAAPTASITETVNAPIIISAAPSTTTGFYVFQNNSLGLSSGDALVINGAVTGAAGNTATTLTLRGANLNSNNAVNGAIGDGAGATAMSVVKNDAGTWLLNGANTYTGTTLAGGGALVFAKTAALYNGDTSKWTASNITVSPGATLGVRVGGAGEFTQADVATLVGGLNTTSTTSTGLTNNSLIGFDTTNAAGGSFVLSNAVTNTATTAVGLRKLGTNTLVLSQPSTYTGGTTVSGGTLRLDGTATLGTGAVSNNGTIQFNSSGASTVTNISGLGGINVTGTGLVSITTNFSSNYNGNASVGPGATLAVLGFGRIAQGTSSTTATDSNVVTVTSTSGIAVGSLVTGTGIPAGTTVTAVNTATGTVTLSAIPTAGGTNSLTYTQVASPNGGTAVAITTTSGSPTATVTDPTGLAVGQNIVSPNFTGTISAINGTTLTLSGNANATSTVTGSAGNSNSAGFGTLFVDGGTVRFTGAAQATSRQVLMGASSAIDGSGTGSLVFNFAPVAFATPNVARAITLTGTFGAGGTGGATNVIGGVIADNGTGAVSLIKNGTGTWRLNGVSTYTGGTVLNSGGLEYNGFTNTVLGTGPLTINGGFLAARGNNATLVNNVVVNANFQFGYDDLAVARNTTLSGTIDLGGAARTITVTNFNGDAPFDAGLTGVVSNGGITKLGTGTLQLAGANTYGGATTVTAGTVLLGSVGAAQNSTVTMNGGTLAFGGTAHTVGGLAAASSGAGFDLSLNSTAAGTPAVALTVGGNNANTTYAGVLSGAGGLTKVGTGTLTLAGANANTGTTTVSGGTLRANVAAYPILLSGSTGVDLGNTGGKLVLDYTGGGSPAGAVKAIVDAGYAGGFTSGQIRSTTLTAGHTIGYGDAANAVTIRVTLPGDADLDGDVDFNDFLSLQTNFGAAGTRFDQGNFNYDGATDFNDFLALQTNFGQSIGFGPVAVTLEQVAAMTAFASNPSNQAVPEPASLALLGLAAAGLVRRRRTAVA